MSPRLASLCLAAALALPLAPLAAATARADDKAAKPEKIQNLDAHLAALEAWTKGDLVARLSLLQSLEAEKKIDGGQRRWMSTRALLGHIRAAGLDKDLPKLCEWIGARKRERKDPIAEALKNCSGPIDDLLETYGTERLYRDEAFAKGDIPAKLKRVKELWNARELHQGTTYALTNDLVYRHLAPAGGDIDAQLKLMGELYRADVMVWDSSASIHEALLHRALYERKELDTTWKRLEWIGKATAQKTGDLAWMITGTLRAALITQAIDGDAAFLAKDAAGRKAQIDEWVKTGTIGSSDRTMLLQAYAQEK